VTVLVVDDQAKMAGLLRRGLSEAGFAVEIAESGEAAVEKARRPDYEAIVLDLSLPGIDGVEVCRQIRKDGGDVPVLLLSTHDAAEDRRAGLDAGADAYMVKPFSFGDLARRLRDLTTQGRPPA
jgi:two-component system, OmpR family, response regulator